MARQISWPRNARLSKKAPLTDLEVKADLQRRYKGPLPFSLQHRETFVYFIREGEDGPIKIGTASRVCQRLTTLQCGNPRTLVCIGYLRGDENKEREIQHRFEHLRLSGEWFRPGPELLVFISCESEETF